jgi:hypothetical protein
MMGPATERPLRDADAAQRGAAGAQLWPCKSAELNGPRLGLTKKSASAGEGVLPSGPTRGRTSHS